MTEKNYYKLQYNMYHPPLLCQRKDLQTWKEEASALLVLLVYGGDLQNGTQAGFASPTKRITCLLKVFFR